MQKIVEVPGIGNVEFPDSMSDDDIAAVLRKQYSGAPSEPTGGKPLAERQAESKAAFEKNLPKSVIAPDANTPWNVLKGLGRGAASLATMAGGAIAGYGKGVPGLDTMVLQGKAAIAPTTAEKVGYYTAAPLPGIGPWAAELGERAGAGDISGAAAELATMMGGPKIASKLPAARRAIQSSDLPRKLLQRAEDIRSAEPFVRIPRTVPLSKFAAINTAIGEVVSRRPIAKTYEMIGSRLAGKDRFPLTRREIAMDEARRIERQLVEDSSRPLITPEEMAANEAMAGARRGVGPMERPPVQPPVQRPPSVPRFIQQQLDEARLQAGYEYYPSGELKPPARPAQPIPFDEARLQAGPPAILTDSMVEMAENAIRPTGLGKKSTLANVPRLLKEVPELVNVRKGANFDARLADAFTKREANVIKAEAAVPREVTVPNPKELIDAIKQEFDPNPHMQQTAAKLGRIVEQWEALPDQVSWEQFRDAKRAFFEENSTVSTPMRRVYGALMESVKGISPELDAANRAYSIVRRAMDDAKIETSSKVIEGKTMRGRRISDVGKEKKPTIFEQIKSKPRKILDLE